MCIKAASDSVGREVSWSYFSFKGMPEKFISTGQSAFANNRNRDPSDDDRSLEFTKVSGVRQGLSYL